MILVFNLSLIDRSQPRRAGPEVSSLKTHNEEHLLRGTICLAQYDPEMPCCQHAAAHAEQTGSAGWAGDARAGPG